MPSGAPRRPTTEEACMMAFLSQYASMIAFFVNIAYYFVIGFSALWAAITFSRYVKYMTSEEIEVAASDSAEDVSVDEFVE
jgi:hypothetical protein